MGRAFCRRGGGRGRAGRAESGVGVGHITAGQQSAVAACSQAVQTGHSAASHTSLHTPGTSLSTRSPQPSLAPACLALLHVNVHLVGCMRGRDGARRRRLVGRKRRARRRPLPACGGKQAQHCSRSAMQWFGNSSGGSGGGGGGGNASTCSARTAAGCTHSSRLHTVRNPEEQPSQGLPPTCGRRWRRLLGLL